MYTYIPKETQGKLNIIARKTIFVGYLPISKQYWLYNPIAKETIVSFIPMFNKNKF